jgi:phosphate transport system substrate-binding protein
MRMSVLAVASVAFAALSCLALAQAPLDIEHAIDPALIPYKAKRQAKGAVSVCGPEDCELLVRAWEKALQKLQPDLKVAFSVAQPADASQQLREGKTQVALMSRTMRSDEVTAFRKAHGARPAGINVGMATLIVIVHPSNPIAAVSLEQLDAIYSATPRRGAPRTATTWGEVGLKNDWAARKIKPVIRSAASGAHTGVAEMVLVKSKFAEQVQYMDPGDKIMEYVASDPQAIGFVASWVGLDTKIVRPVPLLNAEGKGVLPTVDAVLEGHYPVRPLLCYVKYAKGDAVPPAEMVEFLRFAQSREGQTILLQAGAIPLTRDLIEANFELYEDLGVAKE